MLVELLVKQLDGCLKNFYAKNVIFGRAFIEFDPLAFDKSIDHRLNNRPFAECKGLDQVSHKQFHGYSMAQPFRKTKLLYGFMGFSDSLKPLFNELPYYSPSV